MSLLKRDWLRTILYACFILSFSYVMYKSFRKLFAENTAVVQVKKSKPALLYPSVTLCPTYAKALLMQSHEDDIDDMVEDHVVQFNSAWEVGNR